MLNKSQEMNIEKEIQDKNLNAPRVTKAHIDNLFSQLEFNFLRVSETRTLCQASLSGFVIADGFAACVSPKNYDEELGQRIAKSNASRAAYDELWKLEGYRLHCKIKNIDEPVFDKGEK